MSCLPLSLSVARPALIIAALSGSAAAGAETLYTPPPFALTSPVPYVTDNCNQPVPGEPDHWTVHGVYDDITFQPVDGVASPLRFFSVEIAGSPLMTVAEGSCTLDVREDSGVIGEGHCRPLQQKIDYRAYAQDFVPEGEAPQGDKVLFAGPYGGQVDVLVPDGEAPAQGWPTVIFFAGLGGMRTCQFYHTDYPPDSVTEGWSTMPSVARAVMTLWRNGYAIVIPHATTNWAGFVHWANNSPSAELRKRFTTTRDYFFVEELLHRMRSGRAPFTDRFQIDAANLFAAGHSNGGGMASRIALDFPLDIRAIAVNNGLYANCFNLGIQLTEPFCQRAQLPREQDPRVPVLLTHQFEDSVVASTIAKWYAYQLQTMNVGRERPTPWRAVIG